MEWYWQGETEVIVKNPYQCDKSHWYGFKRIRTSVVKGLPPTTWAGALPSKTNIDDKYILKIQFVPHSNTPSPVYKLNLLVIYKEEALHLLGSVYNTVEDCVQNVEFLDVKSVVGKSKLLCSRVKK